MTVGMSADADAGDAVALQQPAFDHFNGACERPGRRVAVAGDDQHMLHARFAFQSGQQTGERLARGEFARGEMRHRLEAGGADRLGMRDHFVDRLAGNGAEIDPQAFRRGRFQRLDVVGLRPRGFERIAGRKSAMRRMSRRWN